MSTTTKTEEIAREVLLPCAFCGGNVQDLTDQLSEDSNWTIRCSGCHMNTAWFSTPREAIAAWNRRTPSPCQRCGELQAQNDALLVRLGDKLIADGTSPEGTIGGRTAVLALQQRTIATLEQRCDELSLALEDMIDLAATLLDDDTYYSGHRTAAKRLEKARQALAGKEGK